MIRDQVMGMFELSNDLLYQKIPLEKRRYYIEESLHIGRAAAERVMNAPGYGGIMNSYQAADIKIEYVEETRKTYGVSFRAQSEFERSGSARVLIYKGSIRELAEHSQCELEMGLIKIDGLDLEKALEVHLAHEFFHYLEYHSSELRDEKTLHYHDLGFVSEYLELIEHLKLFRWSRKAGILRSSEIAAHAFAKEITGLSVLPNYYDYCYLIMTGKAKADEFWAMVENYGQQFL